VGKLTALATCIVEVVRIRGVFGSEGQRCLFLIRMSKLLCEEDANN